MPKERAEFLINGQNIADIDASDRGLAYGDGVFETVLVAGDHWVLWQEHLSRLYLGIERLKLPYAWNHLLDDRVGELLHRFRRSNACVSDNDASVDGMSKCIVKIMITRGSGGRGYSPRGCQHASEILVCFSYSKPNLLFYEQGIEVRSLDTCAHSIPQLAGIKHLNRLEQVLASAELAESEFEGVVFDQNNLLVEGTKSNVILKQKGQWITPRLDHAGVHGVLRQYLLEQSENLGFSIVEKDISQAECSTVSAMALVNSVFGVIPVRKIDCFELDIDSVIDEIQKPIHQIFPF